MTMQARTANKYFMPCVLSDTAAEPELGLFSILRIFSVCGFTTRQGREPVTMVWQSAARRVGGSTSLPHSTTHVDCLLEVVGIARNGHD